MEIEAKYTVLDPQALAELAAWSRLAGFAVADSEVRTITDTYVDTADCALMTAGYACRRRRGAKGTAINLKGLGTQGGPVHRREELAVEIEARAMRVPSRWPASRVRELVISLAGDERLVPLFKLSQKRRIRHLRNDRGEAIAELSLDTVRGSGEGWKQGFDELEIELLPSGSEADLARLVQSVATLPGLVSQPTSKFERAMAMAHHSTGVGEAMALGNVSPGDTMAEATRKLIRPLFLRMQMHESGTYLGDDPEELHDMRVMTRRMRTALRMAEPHLDMSVMRAARRGLRKTARVLGAVRDMDVFRQKTEAYLAQTEADRDDLAPLIGIWDVEYTRRRNQMLTYLTSRPYGRLRDTFWGLLDTSLPEGAVTASVREAVPMIVSEQLKALLELGAETAQSGAPMSAYHRLRIDAKHLRYTLRFFRKVLGPEVDTALDALEVLQDTYGDLQDAVVAVAHLRAVIDHGTWDVPQQTGSLWHAWVGAQPTDGTAPTGLTDYLTAREAEVRAYLAEAPAVWERFHEAEAPLRIQQALAALA